MLPQLKYVACVCICCKVARDGQCHVHAPSHSVACMGSGHATARCGVRWDGFCMGRLMEPSNGPFPRALKEKSLREFLSVTM
jgi:hypothetical protein